MGGGVTAAFVGGGVTAFVGGGVSGSLGISNFIPKLTSSKPLLPSTVKHSELFVTGSITLVSIPYNRSPVVSSLAPFQTLVNIYQLGTSGTLM